jgi:hypothetical protein
MDEPRAAASLEAWALVRKMLDDMTTMVCEDAETELELVEGLRMLGRVTALCSELSLDVDAEIPWFFPMNSEARYVGGPNPDGEYQLAMIDGRHRYRVRGTRGTSSYLGFQVLAGSGLTPRRMAAYLSDFDLAVDDDDTFSFILATAEPTVAELGGGSWVEIPDDASAIVVREYVGDRQRESLAEVTIEPLDLVGPPAVPTDEAVSEQLTAMAWTIAKLATLHRTIEPELLARPNELLTAEAADLGGDNTTPDNLYMLGMFRVEPGQTLLLDIDPPATRYWSVTLENIWHECIDVRRRRSSMTNAAAETNEDGSVRIVIGAEDRGEVNWLDTGRRHRGFIVLRWLDNPTPPRVQLTVTGDNPQ